jgi:hypothetical protein
MTPHRCHLLEMRATRPGATELDKCRYLAAMVQLDYADEWPDAPPADATDRHLAEMLAARGGR